MSLSSSGRKEALKAVEHVFHTPATPRQPVHTCSNGQHTFKEGFSAASRSSLRLTGAATLVRFSPPPDGLAAGFCAVSSLSSATRHRCRTMCL